MPNFDPRPDQDQQPTNIWTECLKVAGLSSLSIGTFFAASYVMDEWPGTRDLSEAEKLCTDGVYGDRCLTIRHPNGAPFELTVPARDYEDYQSSWSLRGFCGTNFVTADDPVINELAAALTYGLNSPEAKARALLRFVQEAIPYDEVEAAADRNYSRYPVETLYELRGDCEDKSFLFASLCQAAGVDVVLLEFPRHMAVGVAGSFQGTSWNKSGVSYFYAETTHPGWRIGDNPDEYEDAVILKL